MNPVNVDVLIIGGGSQGLWLLNDLNDAGYRTILLEREELGSGQTCHSHALIHRGHYYDNVQMMILLNAAAQFWRGFINRVGLEPLNQSPALVGLGFGVEQRYTYMWDCAGLTYQKLDVPPPVLLGSRVPHLFRTEEFSLDSSVVMSRLAENVDYCLYKLDGGDTLKFSITDKRVDAVGATIDGRSVMVHPKMVVLCAGGQNVELLERLGGAYEDDRLVQARRQSTMLCLQSPDLPPLTAVFPVKSSGGKGLFICSRKCPETSETVWLVSDHNSTPFNPGVGEAGNKDPRPIGMVVTRIIESLKACIPNSEQLLKNKSLKACVYTGLTSERDLGEGIHMPDCYIEPFSFENVLTVWPTKLTLTPMASNIAMRFIRTKLPIPLSQRNRWPEVGDENLPNSRPKIALETWRKAPFQKDDGFKSEWLPFATLTRQYSQFPPRSELND